MSMANTRRLNTGGNQFFINTVDNTYLDKEDSRAPYVHPIFGTVVSGIRSSTASAGLIQT